MCEWKQVHPCPHRHEIITINHSCVVDRRDPSWSSRFADNLTPLHNTAMNTFWVSRKLTNSHESSPSVMNVTGRHGLSGSRQSANIFTPLLNTTLHSHDLADRTWRSAQMSQTDKRWQSVMICHRLPPFWQPVTNQCIGQPSRTHTLIVRCRAASSQCCGVEGWCFTHRGNFIAPFSFGQNCLGKIAIIISLSTFNN